MSVAIGQRGGATVAQLAPGELALDLQPDDEEEQRHQAVVDPVLQVLVNPGDVHVGGPEREVGVTRGRVGPDDGHDGGGEQHDAARRLVMEELRQRAAA
jgi:hypothetical protein